MHDQAAAAMVWLITGVSSGLGRALAEAVLAVGHAVVGTLRQAEAIADFEALAPGRAHAMLLDVTDQAAVQACVDAVQRRFGAVDVLVNNAGYGLVGGVEEASLAEARAQFEVNVLGALAMMQAVLPGMRARRSGHLVAISSVSGRVGWPGLGIYTASKFALEGLCETLAQEVAEFGIRLTLVEPGGFRTDFAGRSRSLVAAPLPAYATGVLADCKRTLAEHAGRERGDPHKAARAILQAVTADHPPLRLLLGPDALAYVQAHQAAVAADDASWRALALTTDRAADGDD